MLVTVEGAWKKDGAGSKARFLIYAGVALFFHYQQNEEYYQTEIDEMIQSVVILWLPRVVFSYIAFMNIHTSSVSGGIIKPSSKKKSTPKSQ